MSTFVDFVPSTASAFQFQPTLAGNPYNVTVTWNIFGQRYYINLYDLSGNLLLCRAMCSSGPTLQASFGWVDGYAVATTTIPHSVPIGGVAKVVVSRTSTTFDGTVQALSTGANTLAYLMSIAPAVALPVSGAVNFALNLVEGLGLGFMLYHFDTQQFEF